MMGDLNLDQLRDEIDFALSLPPIATGSASTRSVLVRARAALEETRTELAECSIGHRCSPECNVPLTWQSDQHWTRLLATKLRVRTAAYRSIALLRNRDGRKAAE